MDSFKTTNVAIIAGALLAAFIIAFILGVRANDNADRHRERSENICVAHGYQWVKEDCLYPPKGNG